MAHPHWYLPHAWSLRFRAAFDGAIDLDPCAAHPDLDTVGAAQTYLWPAQDGLALPWRGRVYCNPPYDRRGIRLFTDKALAEAEHCEQLAMLVPLRPSARWWRDLARSAETLSLITKRIPFIDGSADPKPGTTGRSELCVFGWRLAQPSALGVVVTGAAMKPGLAVEQRGQQRTLDELLRREPSEVPRHGAKQEPLAVCEQR